MSLINFDFSQFEQIPIDFSYDGKIWTGMITRNPTPNCAGKPRQFVNIKLPNDGFLYSSTYLDETANSPNALVETPETMEFIAKIRELVEPVPDFDYNVFANYKLEEGRLEFYFEDDVNAKTLTLKFEYGTCKKYERQKVYTKQQLQQLIDSIMKRNPGES